MTTNINWKTISNAIDYYRSLGFVYVETPWKVDPSSARITMPPEGQIEAVDEYALVASGEQGFLDLEQIKDDRIKQHVNYVTCTPCFRESDRGRSELHQPYFMKVELYSRCDSESVAKKTSLELMDRARKFMKKVPYSVEQDGHWDLQIEGIEVGSYGHRFHEDIGHWAYGTGVAEPRYSQALEILKKELNELHTPTSSSPIASS